MIISKEDYELLKEISQSPDQCLNVGGLLTEKQIAQVERLLDHRHIKLDKNFGIHALYRITKAGIAAIREFETNSVAEMIEEADVNKYPALFENKATGVIVLAVNPTCGTIVKEATVEFRIGQYPLHVGTFQTCFQPFFDETVWKRINFVTVEL